MFSQSITGIRSNLKAFNQAAIKIAQPQDTLVPLKNHGASPTADRSAKAQTDYLDAASTSSKALDKTSTTRRPARAQDANAPRETANEPGTRSPASQVVDQAQETVNMMVAQRGVEANLGVLKTAMSLSGQTVDILA
jgi:hypothetical protein